MIDIARLDEVPNLRTAALDAITMNQIEGGYSFEGHAAVFDHEADLGEWTESISHGAFRKVLQEPGNIPLLVEHDPGKVLATTESGLLKLSEDARGLRVEAAVPDTSLARDLVTQVKSGIVKGMSFGFIAGRGNSVLEKRSGKPHRRITGFTRLIDTTLTWNPAYSATDAQFRSAALVGAYTLPNKQRPRTTAEIALELDEMEVQMRESDRQLRELGLLD